MRNTTITLCAGDVSLATLREIYLLENKIALADQFWEKVDTGHRTVMNIVAKDEATYGINTGFGLLAQTRIANDELALLQKNLVLSHAAGVGVPLKAQIVRLIMVLKVISLSQGYSGVRKEVIQLLLAMINHQVIPAIPEKGSVGASGDLAPLAHMTCCMIGEGEAYIDGEKMPAKDALAKKGLQPIVLQAKEGLALLNGTQTSTALALVGLFEAEHLFASAMVIGAMSVEGLKGSIVPFDARIHQARRQKGQIDVAKCLREFLQESQINASHENCDKVQDPYSLRCQPQVMGAALDMLRYAASILHTESNAVTDNPLIFSDTQEALSGGNFHAEPVAMVADAMAIAISEIGAISERRLAILVDPKMSGLPAFLVKNSGVNSGFMIAQVSAAALASENKSLAHPASVDSLPTSANQEDHVSMATYAARRLQSMNFNATSILGIELLAAAQAVEFSRPLKSSAIIEKALAQLREIVPPLEQDRYFANDIEQAYQLIANGDFYSCVTALLPTQLG